VKSNRLEAFTDGVLAIAITVMVLELRVPTGGTFHDLRLEQPKLLAYVLSFVYLAIYWNNHHHLMQVVDRVDGRVLWANMHLLFWLSLVPFGTAWMGEHARESAPVIVYGVMLLGAGVAYYLLTRALLALHDTSSALAIALGKDWKGKVSVLAYVVALALAGVATWLAIVIFSAVAIVWLIPDRRIARVVDGGAR